MRGALQQDQRSSSHRGLSGHCDVQCNRIINSTTSTTYQRPGSQTREKAGEEAGTKT